MFVFQFFNFFINLKTEKYYSKNNNPNNKNSKNIKRKKTNNAENNKTAQKMNLKQYNQ
jgi:hypothetical protein